MLRSGVRIVEAKPKDIELMAHVVGEYLPIALVSALIEDPKMTVLEDPEGLKDFPLFKNPGEDSAEPFSSQCEMQNIGEAVHESPEPE